MIRIRKMTNLSGRGFSPVLTPRGGRVYPLLLWVHETLDPCAKIQEES